MSSFFKRSVVASFVLSNIEVLKGAVMSSPDVVLTRMAKRAVIELQERCA
jgi:hypothetical protein